MDWTLSFPWQALRIPPCSPVCPPLLPPPPCPCRASCARRRRTRTRRACGWARPARWSEWTGASQTCERCLLRVGWEELGCCVGRPSAGGTLAKEAPAAASRSWAGRMLRWAAALLGPHDNSLTPRFPTLPPAIPPGLAGPTATWWASRPPPSAPTRASAAPLLRSQIRSRRWVPTAV